MRELRLFSYSHSAAVIILSSEKNGRLEELTDQEQFEK